MKPDVDRFLRNTHILARLVEYVLEDGYLGRTSGGELTFDQLNILKFLARPRPSLVKDVARFLHASCAAASKAVSRLEKKKLVTVRPFEGDRRAELIQVTPRGRALIRNYERLKSKRLRMLLRGHDADALSGNLETVISMLISERPMAGDPCLGCGAYYTKKCVVRAHGHSCACPE